MVEKFFPPTSTLELARQIAEILDCKQSGIYHATAEGECSWYRFAQEIFSLAKLKANLKVAAPGEIPTKVKRPKYSVLENRALKRTGINRFQKWNEALAEYLQSTRKKS